MAKPLKARVPLLPPLFRGRDSRRYKTGRGALLQKEALRKGGEVHGGKASPASEMRRPYGRQPWVTRLETPMPLGSVAFSVSPKRAWITRSETRLFGRNAALPSPAIKSSRLAGSEPEMRQEHPERTWVSSDEQAKKDDNSAY